MLEICQVDNACLWIKTKKSAGYIKQIPESNGWECFLQEDTKPVATMPNIYAAIAFFLED